METAVVGGQRRSDGRREDRGEAGQVWRKFEEHFSCCGGCCGTVKTRMQLRRAGRHLPYEAAFANLPPPQKVERESQSSYWPECYSRGLATIFRSGRRQGQHVPD